MNKCRNPEHPHCTVWVMPGESVCAHGHPQPGNAVTPVPAAGRLEPVARQAVRPHLHVSGFDPRACGGRYSIRLELRGMPADLPPQLALRTQTTLPLQRREPLAFTRAGGGWRPVFIEFSSRAVEHGQHRIELELHSPARAWACTLVLNLPRRDATLADIHQAFLATHKNVRITADDGSIARVNARTFGRLDIEVNARDASIAQLDLQAEPGKADVGIATIAWDEDLVEVEVPSTSEVHPCPASAACLACAEPVPGLPRHIRLLALDEFVLGRFEASDPEADLLLSHFTESGPVADGLTRRLSARHAVIRRARDGYEIEDVSRYGLLLDGSWPGKHVPMPLRLGMHIELTASIRGVVELVVSSLLPNGVVLHRLDAGIDAECFCLLEPNRRPEPLAPGRTLPQAARLPLLFHDGGGFWHRDAASGHDAPLAPPSGPGQPSPLPGKLRFAAGAYLAPWTARSARDRRRSRAAEPPAGV